MVRESGGQPRHFSPPFTLKYAQSLLIEDKNQVKLLDYLVSPEPLEILLNDVLCWPASLIIIDSSTYSKQAAFQLAHLIKKNSDILTVAIGQGPTSDYSDYSSVASPFDIVLSGETEQEIACLVKRLNEGEDIKELKRAHYDDPCRNETNIIRDLDILPFPKYSRAELQHYKFFYPVRLNKRLTWGHILSSRGCSSSCIFCSQVARETYGVKVRLRSAANVVDEIECLMSRGVNIVSFDDDNFSNSRKHAENVSKEIVRRNLDIKWIAHARADELTFPLMDSMKKAGCILLRLGVESGSERIIEILKKKRGSESWVETNRRIFHYARRIGIATNALLMIGNPTETENEIKETLQLAKALRPDLIQLHFFVPYPGSLVYEQFKAKINKEDLSESYHYCAPKINLSSVSSDRLQGLRTSFYQKFFFRPSFLAEHFCRYVFFYIRNVSAALKLFRGYKIFLRTLL